MHRFLNDVVDGAIVSTQPLTVRIILLVVPKAGDTEIVKTARAITRLILAVYTLGIYELVVRRTRNRVFPVK